MNKGWKNESARHSLAARGVKSRRPMKSQVPVQLQPPRSDIKKMKEHILSNFGGDGFQLDWVLNRDFSKDEVKQLMSRGEVRDGKAFKLQKMSMSGCHINSAELASRNYAIDIWTGMALSDDGLWRVHTWVYDSKNQKYIETTERRIKYFGYKLNGKERDEFIFMNPW